MTETSHFQMGQQFRDSACPEGRLMDELGLKPRETVNLTVEGRQRRDRRPKKPKKITPRMDHCGPRGLGRENAPETVTWGADRPGERIDDAYSRGEITENDPEGR